MQKIGIESVNNTEMPFGQQIDSAIQSGKDVSEARYATQPA